MNRSDLTGRRAVVTGAAMGIGRAIATRLARAGADVLLVDINGDALVQAVDLMPKGARIASMAADLTDPATPAAVIATCDEELGPVDVLVNNAGIFPFASVGDVSLELVDRVISLNLTATILLSQAAGVAMAAHGTGAIVNIAALAGHEPYSGLLVYSASKAGVLAATRGLALELAPSGVRVNSISPGPIDSGHADGLAGVGDEQRAAIGAAFIAGIPMGRIGEATEIAEAALFLASDASSFMTGADLFVDGGSHLT